MLTDVEMPLVGVLAGLFGIGGGAVIIPVLYEVFGVLDVPENLPAEMTKATSKGGFFNHHIRDRFPFTRR